MKFMRFNATGLRRERLYLGRRRLPLAGPQSNCPRHRHIALMLQQPIAPNCRHIPPVHLRLQQVKLRRGGALRVDLHYRGGEVRPVVDVLVDILRSVSKKNSARN